MKRIKPKDILIKNQLAIQPEKSNKTSAPTIQLPYTHTVARTSIKSVGILKKFKPEIMPENKVTAKLINDSIIKKSPFQKWIIMARRQSKRFT